MGVYALRLVYEDVHAAEFVLTVVNRRELLTKLSAELRANPNAPDKVLS
jgi:hypothetical protein